VPRPPTLILGVTLNLVIGLSGLAVAGSLGGVVTGAVPAPAGMNVQGGAAAIALGIGAYGFLVILGAAGLFLRSRLGWMVCLDVGASTGGFTDVLLQRGAARVHAIDVGRGQLADRLRADSRVVAHDRTNARHLTPESVGERIDLAVVDVSFISLELVLGPIEAILHEARGPIVALVKPQFEVGKGGTDRGVVRDPAAHRTFLERIVEAAARVGLGARAVIASPILGPDGNREFLVHLQAGPGCAEIGERIREATGG
jgi:23S rRNA (cytidine1920-2'-O)/16S rRNA (cytidine1409-2'-O)-methyltransferase